MFERPNFLQLQWNCCFPDRKWYAAPRLSSSLCDVHSRRDVVGSTSRPISRRSPASQITSMNELPKVTHGGGREVEHGVRSPPSFALVSSPSAWPHEVSKCKDMEKGAVRGQSEEKWISKRGEGDKGKVKTFCCVSVCLAASWFSIIWFFLNLEEWRHLSLQ